MEEEMEVLLPTPAPHYVIIENPLGDKMTELQKEVDKLPEKDRVEYVKKHATTMFENIKIMKVGAGVWFKENSLGISTPERLQDGVGIIDGKYIIVRETSIISVW